MSGKIRVTGYADKKSSCYQDPSLSDQRRDFFICERRIGRYLYQLDDLIFIWPSVIYVEIPRKKTQQGIVMYATY